MSQPDTTNQPASPLHVCRSEGLPGTRHFREAAGRVPPVAITLGSGLGAALDGWNIVARWPWSDFLSVTAGEVPGHRRELILAEADGRRVLLVSGRLHFYQGVGMDEVTAYVRLLADAGVHTLVLTNAAGGLNPEFQVGDLMVIADHINMPGLAGQHPLRGGAHFLDSTNIYAPSLRAFAHRAAASAGFVLREGVYAMVGGPSYETPAEQRLLRALGADAVGMSTVPEALVARHRGMEVLAFSSITNVAGAASVSHTEVLAAGAQVAQRLAAILRVLLPDLDQTDT
jgi:purine-nucleoside phosphorylase